VVTIAATLVNSGAVRLCGKLAGRCFDVLAAGLAGGFYGARTSKAELLHPLVADPLRCQGGSMPTSSV
jgi:hypothetical protein